MRQVAVDLNRGRVLGEDGRPKRPCGVEGLTAQGRAAAGPAGGAGLGKLALVLLLDGVVGLALGDHLLAVGGQLVGGQVALLGGGAFEDGFCGLAGRAAPLAQVVEQGHAGRPFPPLR
jgi:hypothetical protein